MPEKVTIPLASFELSVDFIRPIIAIWLDRAVLVQAMFDALAKWKLDVNDVEGITTGKPSEQGVKIKLSSKRCTVFFGAASFKFSKDDADWSTAEETIEILDAALGTLIRVSGAEIVSYKTSLAMHVQPAAKNFYDLLQPFLSPQLTTLAESRPNSGASIIKWETGRIVLDGSAALANGLFIRYERTFSRETSYQKMAKEIRVAEEAIFKLLDVEENTL
jgi:hypothetical protein